MKKLIPLASLALLSFHTFAQGTAFTYQGRLNAGANPANGIYDLRFGIYDLASGGAQQGNALTNTAVTVENGLFTATLDFGANFPGAARWLEIGVRTNGSGSFVTLAPRQPITPAPYAITAGSANNLPGLTVQQNSNGAPNVIGGASINYVSNTVVGATIAGGGATNFNGNRFTNRVTANFGTVSGGADNTASEDDATVGGGFGNTASGQSATVGGGGNNTASGYASTVGGGGDNTASAHSATVSGGSANTASGVAATVSGGYNNDASGSYSFAAGRRAKANHTGAFVWADSTDADFASTGANQFLIRASGGVGIGTTAPEADLHVFRGSAGSVTANATAPLVVESDGNAFINLLSPSNAISGLLFGSPVNAIDASVRYNNSGINRELSFRTLNSQRMVILTNGFVGIGTTAPTNTLHVAGGVSATAFVNTSDRNAKENFAPVSPVDVLNKVAALPITTWNFKSMNDGRHMGPMAQDFYAAFGLGGGDTTITSVDPDGVALAAIQGLNEKVEKENAALRLENSELKVRLDKLERRLSEKASGPQ